MYPIHRVKNEYVQVLKGVEINRMNQVRNYQKELEKIIEQLSAGKETPSLLLHSCCAPCSSYCLEYLRQYFKITVFYYNPNISMEEEYRKRVAEQKRLIAAYNAQNLYYPIDVIEGDYETEAFYTAKSKLCLLCSTFSDGTTRRFWNIGWTIPCFQVGKSRQRSFTSTQKPVKLM